MIIVLSGKAGSGKTVVESALKQVLLDNRIIYYSRAYADELKEMLMRDLNLTYSQVYGKLKEVEDERYPKENGSFWTPRDFLQYFGTDVYRNIDSSFWVNKLRQYVDSKGTNCIISDARFTNEIDWVRDSGGIHFDIVRSTCGAKYGSTHSSEVSLDNVQSDYTIMNNNNSVEELLLYLNDAILPIILSKINGET